MDCCKFKNYKGEYALDMVKDWGYALIYIRNQTEEICTEAVKEEGEALAYVKEQTENICLEAVKEDGYALQFVKEQTPEICYEAVKQDGCALQFVEDFHPELLDLKSDYMYEYKEHFTKEIAEYNKTLTKEYTIEQLEAMFGHKIKIKGNE